MILKMDMSFTDISTQVDRSKNTGRRSLYPGGVFVFLLPEPALVNGSGWPMYGHKYGQLKASK
jgi:hypothetical protein